MKLIAGVDIGNSTTEVCIGTSNDLEKMSFLADASTTTTGTKGTVANVTGINKALTEALAKVGKECSDLDLIRINEAAPVIGDTAMETITETIITESSMIGHNPSTPAGAGQAVGTLIYIENLNRGDQTVPYIIVASRKFSYEEIAERINSYQDKVRIVGLILQADEAVLVRNRIQIQIPIVDEVTYIEKVPEGKIAAIEVALPGQGISMLSNPFGIATLLFLNAEETKQVTPIAKSLIGKCSAVVIKTPGGNVRENVLPAGEIFFAGTSREKVNIDAGAEEIMAVLAKAGQVQDITGQENTNVGNMLQAIKKGMSDLTGEPEREVKITDILAVDTMAPVAVSGALAGETCMEKAVGIAAMVKTKQLPMEKIANQIKKQLGVETIIAGVEAVMATLGALTTPGTRLPFAILDLGGGSTDSVLLEEDGKVKATHLAGAGELVTMLIQTELGISSRQVAEMVKKYPLAKVESLFHMRLENGEMKFFERQLDPRFFGRVVLMLPDEMIRLEEDIPMEKIVAVRREAKRKVFIENVLRALKTVAPEGDLKKIPNVVLVGGSAADFEIAEMLTEELSAYRIVCGRGNVRSVKGPRNAVATGLVLSYFGGKV